MTTENEIQEFVNAELGAEIRVIDKDGEPWFVAKDICSALGIVNTSDAVNRLDTDETNTIVLNDGTPGNPIKTIVSESGLYNLVIRSDKPEARLFKRWITHEVLPAIRKHGLYMTNSVLDQVLADPRYLAEILTTLADERDRRVVAEEKLHYLKPAAPYGTPSIKTGNPRTQLVKPYWRDGWRKIKTVTTTTEWQRTLFD